MKTTLKVIGAVVFGLSVLAAAVFFCAFYIALVFSIPDGPWCDVITTTGEISREQCPPGFNAGERLYWDNAKHIYVKAA